MGCGASAVHPDYSTLVPGDRVAVCFIDGNEDSELFGSSVMMFLHATIISFRKKVPRVKLRLDNGHTTLGSGKAFWNEVRLIQPNRRMSRDCQHFDSILLTDEVAYPNDARVLVFHDLRLRDGVVLQRRPKGSRYSMRIAGQNKPIVIDLNAFNSVPQRFASAGDFEAARARYCELVVKEKAMVEGQSFVLDRNAITGNELSIEDQLIYITTDVEGMGGLVRKEWSEVSDVKGLVPLLTSASSKYRPLGSLDATPLLVRAGPGTGKTWTMQQLLYLLAKELREPPSSGVPLVPFVVYVQRLARLLRRQKDGGGGGAQEGSLVLAYIRSEYFGSEHKEQREMLEQAYELRSMIVLLDGVDEAAGLRDRIGELIFDELIPMGVHFVVTSRPEGVDERLRDYQSRFVVMDLKPLNEEQQRKVIEFQLQGNDFFDHLLAFSTIRTKHDELFRVEAFPDDGERARIEGFGVPNRFELGGGYDPTMRQSIGDGSRIVAELPTAAAPASQELAGLNKKLTELDAFAQLNAMVLAEKRDEEIEAAVAEWCPVAVDPETGKRTLPRHIKVAQKLGKLLSQEARNESSLGADRALLLWGRIMAKTDEIFEVAEKLKPVFEEVACSLQAKLGCELKLGPTKDPVRIHEKAKDDYTNRFDGGELAEACVVDVLRARLVCSTGALMLRFFKLLKPQYEHRLSDGTVARLELIRAKNKFAEPDPTHFRNVLCNLRLVVDGGASIFVEIQVHHDMILDYNDKARAHEHYEYFRSVMKDAYDKDLGAQLDFHLEKRMEVFREISSIPVQLSMLCLVLMERDEGRDKAALGAAGLPNDQRELYETAVACVLRSRLGDSEEEQAVASSMLRRLAVANHADRRREFGSEDVAAAFLERADEAALWERLQREEEGVPLIKTIVLPEGNEPGEYQFKHLSFQENLFVQAVERDEIEWPPKDKAELVKCLSDPFFRNALKIGGGALARRLPPWKALGDSTHQYDGDFTGQLGAVALESLALLLPEAPGEALRLSKCNIDRVHCAIICAALEANTALQTLDLSHGGEGCGDEGCCEAIRDLLKKSSPLRTIVLAHNYIYDVGLIALAAGLKQNATLQELDLSDNRGRIGLEGYKALRAALETNNTLTTISLPRFRFTFDESRRLDLSRRELLSGDALVIGALCRDSRSVLETLDLSRNQIGFEGCEALGEMLASSATLKELNINFNHFSDFSCAAIARALKNNRVLRELKMGGNTIGPRFCQAIGGALETNSTLVTLSFDRFSFDLGAAELDLSDRGLEYSDMLVIAALCRVSKSMLETLDLSYNPSIAQRCDSLAFKVKAAASRAGFVPGQPLRILFSDDGPLPGKFREYQQDGSLGVYQDGQYGHADRYIPQVLPKFVRRMDEFDPCDLPPAVRSMPKNSTRDDVTLNNGTTIVCLEHTAEGRFVKMDPSTKIDGGESDDAGVLAGLLKSTNLRKLTLRKIFVDTLVDSHEDYRFPIVAHALSKNTTLLELDICENCIFDEGYKALGKALTRNDTLVTISTDQFLFDTGATKLTVGWEGRKKIIGGAFWAVAALCRGSRSKVESLNLRYNELGDEGCEAFCKSLKNNTTIRKLNLASNEIKAAGFAVLAEALACNTTLTHLDISDNQGIGDKGKNALGEALVAKNTTLTTLSFSVGDGRRNFSFEPCATTEISLDDCGFNDGDALLVARLCWQSKSVPESLDLHNNKVSDSGCAIIAQMLECNTTNDSTILKLNLAGNDIRDGGCAAIARMLECNTTILELNLAGNDIRDGGYAALADALKKNKTLTQLEIAPSPDCTDDVYDVIAEALETNNTLTTLSFAELSFDLSATELDLSGRRLSNKFRRSPSKLAALCRGSRAPMLEKLVLRDCGIDDAGCAAIAAALKENKTLTHLDLGGNCPGVECSQALNATLESNTTLAMLLFERFLFDLLGAAATELDFSKRKLNCTDAAIIAPLCRWSRPTLVRLDLSMNDVRDEGCGTICTVLLENNVALRTLNLSNANLREEGLKAIGVALGTNTVLRQLELEGNWFGLDEGCKALSVALKQNSVLEELNLCSCNIRDGGAQAFCDDVLKGGNTTLQRLDLRWNVAPYLFSNPHLEHWAETGRLLKPPNHAEWLRKRQAGVTHKTLKDVLSNQNYGFWSSRGTKLIAVTDNHDRRTPKITNWGCELIYEFLNFSNIVTEIRITYQWVGDEGAMVLSEALKHRSTIQTLDLSRNMISDDGAKAIAGALLSNASGLFSVKLFCNEIGDQGARALCEAMQYRTAAYPSFELDLSDNFISDACVTELEKSLRHVKALQLKHQRATWPSQRPWNSGQRPRPPRKPRTLPGGAAHAEMISRMNAS